MWLLAKAQSDSLSGFPNMLTQQNPEMARVSPDPLPILVGVASGHETSKIGPKMGGATLKVGGAKKIARALMHGKGAFLPVINDLPAFVLLISMVRSTSSLPLIPLQYNSFFTAPYLRPSLSLPSPPSNSPLLTTPSLLCLHLLPLTSPRSSHACFKFQV